MSTDDLHRDVSAVKWSAGTLTLIEKVQPDADVRNSDYIDVSAPHTELDCPYRLHDSIRLNRVTWAKKAARQC